MTGNEVWAAIALGGIGFLTWGAKSMYQLVLMAKANKNGTNTYSKTYSADLARHHADMMDRFGEMRTKMEKSDEVMDKFNSVLKDIKGFLDRNEKDHEKQMNKHDAQISVLNIIADRMNRNDGRP